MRTIAGLTAPSTRHRRRAAATGAVIALGTLAATAVTARVTVTFARDLSGQPRLTVDDAVPLVALLVLVMGLLWLTVVTAAGAREVLRRQSPPRLPDHLGRVPLAGRVAALLLAITALGAGVAGTPAQATTVAVTVTPETDGTRTPLPVPDFATPSPDLTSAGSPGNECTLPEPGWTSSGPGLQRPASTDRAGLLGRCTGPRSGADVVVHRGDSLWSIVERDLGPDASAAEIAEIWPQWYAANRDVIGPDPDVLLPGTTLHRPTQEALR